LARSLKERYLTWLMGRVAIGEDYTMLCRYMLNTDYIFFCSNDDNRATDGLDLRYEFENRYGWIEDLSDECSILEMLVALSIRCDDVMFDPEYGHRTDFWFFEMIKNLELDKFDDDFFDQRAVNSILEDFIYRHYGKNGGRGCAFKVKKPLHDMRTTELWYQMMWWLNENFE